MRNTAGIVTCVVSSFLLATTTTALAGKRDAPVGPFDFGADPKAQAAQYVEAVRGNNFAKIKKLGIVNFAVEFALKKEATTRLPLADQSFQTLTIQVPEPDVAALQAIVDEVYAGIQEDFRSMGIEIVPFETLRATKSFAKLDKAQHEAPWKTTMKDAHSLFLAPTGMPLYLDNIERAGWLKQLGFTFGTNTRMQEVKMTYDIEGGCHLVSINMVVDFATIGLSKGKIEADDILHLQAGNTSYRFVSNTQPELMYVKLAQPVVSSATLWSQTGESKEETKAIDSKTETTTRTGVFDAASYQSEVRKLLTAARAMFAAELASLR